MGLGPQRSEGHFKVFFLSYDILKFQKYVETIVLKFDVSYCKQVGYEFN